VPVQPQGVMAPAPAPAPQIVVVERMVPVPPAPQVHVGGSDAEVQLFYGCKGDPLTATVVSGFAESEANDVCFTDVDVVGPCPSCVEGDNDDAAAMSDRMDDLIARHAKQLHALESMVTTPPQVVVKMTTPVGEGERVFVWSKPMGVEGAEAVQLVGEIEGMQGALEAPAYEGVEYGVVVARDEAQALTRVRDDRSAMPSVTGPGDGQCSECDDC